MLCCVQAVVNCVYVFCCFGFVFVLFLYWGMSRIEKREDGSQIGREGMRKDLRASKRWGDRRSHVPNLEPFGGERKQYNGMQDHEQIGTNLQRTIEYCEGYGWAEGGR